MVSYNRNKQCRYEKKAHSIVDRSLMDMNLYLLILITKLLSFFFFQLNEIFPVVTTRLHPTNQTLYQGKFRFRSHSTPDDSLSSPKKHFTQYVGIVGFEPTTPCSQSRCSTKLSYIPLGWTPSIDCNLFLKNNQY